MPNVTLSLTAGEALELLYGINSLSRELDAAAANDDELQARRKDADNAARKLGSALRAAFPVDPDPWAPKLDTPLKALNITVRTRNCLAKMGVHTARDLTRMTEAEFDASKNFGETSKRELISALAAHGVAIFKT